MSKNKFYGRTWNRLTEQLVYFERYLNTLNIRVVRGARNGILLEGTQSGIDHHNRSEAGFGGGTPNSYGASPDLYYPKQAHSSSNSPYLNGGPAQDMRVTNKKGSHDGVGLKPSAQYSSQSEPQGNFSFHTAGQQEPRRRHLGYAEEKPDGVIGVSPFAQKQPMPKLLQGFHQPQRTKPFFHRQPGAKVKNQLGYSDSRHPSIDVAGRSEQDKYREGSSITGPLTSSPSRDRLSQVQSRTGKSLQAHGAHTRNLARKSISKGEHSSTTGKGTFGQLSLEARQNASLSQHKNSLKSKHLVAANAESLEPSIRLRDLISAHTRSDKTQTESAAERTDGFVEVTKELTGGNPHYHEDFFYPCAVDDVKPLKKPIRRRMRQPEVLHQGNRMAAASQGVPQDVLDRELKQMDTQKFFKVTREAIRKNHYKHMHSKQKQATPKKESAG